jgi:hypothetical protein
VGDVASGGFGIVKRSDSVFSSCETGVERAGSVMTSQVMMYGGKVVELWAVLTLTQGG